MFLSQNTLFSGLGLGGGMLLARRCHFQQLLFCLSSQHPTAGNSRHKTTPPTARACCCHHPNLLATSPCPPKTAASRSPSCSSLSYSWNQWGGPSMPLNTTKTSPWPRSSLTSSFSGTFPSSLSLPMQTLLTTNNCIPGNLDFCIPVSGQCLLNLRLLT